VPCGNGVAARALLRLGHLLGEPRYLEAAERTLRAAYSTMQQMPQACPTLLRALNDFLDPRTHVVVRFGEDADASAWRDAAGQARTYRCDLYPIPAAAAGLRGTLAAQAHVAGGVAYVCRGTSCLPALTDPDELVRALTAG